MSPRRRRARRCPETSRSTVPWLRRLMTDSVAAMDEGQRPLHESRPKVEAISAEQAASFAILRREQVAGDQLPRGRRDAVDGGGMARRRGLNSALARRAATQIGDVWVVPGNGYVALLVDGGAVCTETGFVARQGTVTWTSQDGKGIVHGLVPDGVTEVTLFDSEDAPTSVLVTENVYGARLARYFRSLRFTGPAGKVELGPWS